MQIQTLPDPQSAAHEAALFIAAQARAAIAERGRFILAVSGGRTPWLMLNDLAGLQLPWEAIHIVQVDERVAPPDDADRNLTHLRESLAPLAPGLPHIYPMPVELPDLNTAAGQYAQTLRELAGTPPVIDLVHLGLGPDGHTASLVPGDPVLDITESDVAVTAPYQGRARITLTYPVINRSRQILWLVTGSDKASMFARLRESDPSIPAGRVRNGRTLILADRAAAGEDD